MRPPRWRKRCGTPSKRNPTPRLVLRLPLVGFSGDCIARFRGFGIGLRLVLNDDGNDRLGWSRERFVVTAFKFVVGGSIEVSALLVNPPKAKCCFVFAHGAGAGMTHGFMEAVATGLFERGVATLRYQFPYMEKATRRPDAPPTAHATVRAAVAEAARQCPDLPLFAGGKSFGGRMTSQAHATVPLAHVHGLVFLGFPLHPAGKPSVERTKHLFDIQIPMLFLQGTRDKLAELPLLERTTQKLGTRASLRLFENADHSFHVPARSGRNDRDVMDDILNSVAAWVGARLSDQTPFDAIRAT